MARCLLVLCVLLLAACGGRAEVVDPHRDLNLSGNWNDVDSRTVAADLAAQCLGAGWIDAFQQAHGRAPVVRLGHIRVRTEDLDDEIDTGIFTADLQRALIDSQRVRAVAARGEAGIQRSERGDLQANAQGAPRSGQELAPDYLLSGSVITQNDAVKDDGVVGGTLKRVKFYRVTFSLTDLASNELVWSGRSERKKLIEQSTLDW